MVALCCLPLNKLSICECKGNRYYWGFMTLLTYTHKRAIGLGIGVVVLALLFPTAFDVVFASRDEVSYEAGINFSTCGDLYFNTGEDRSRCTTQFLVVLGNTGTVTQERVTVELDYVPEVQRLNWTLLDIVASSVRAPRAGIIEERKNQGRGLTITGLVPNRLVEISFTARGPEAQALMDTINVRVTATGRVINSNPHLTVLSRLAKNLLSVFGF